MFLLSLCMGGTDSPSAICAHSSQSVAVSTNLFSCMSVEEICTTACGLPCPFMRFYLLDMADAFSGSVRKTSWCVPQVIGGTPIPTVPVVPRGSQDSSGVNSQAKPPSVLQPSQGCPPGCHYSDVGIWVVASLWPSRLVS